MCGYLRRDAGSQTMREYYSAIRLPIEWPKNPEGIETLHMYPAFGGAVNRKIFGLIIREGDELKSVDATWWFDCKESGDSLAVNNSRTTFNARNLSSPYWRGAVRHHRGIAVATGIGEGKMISGKNTHFLVESDKPILMGCVYRSFPNGCYSTAVITRDTHDRFQKYHDKAFPLMLPHDKNFLELWLSDTPETEPAIADLLEHPKIFNNLKITPVKTFKDGKSVGEAELLAAD